MPQLCNQCAFDSGFTEGDFAGRVAPEFLPLKPGQGVPVHCHGCGFVLVDEHGTCLGGDECTQEHHSKAAVSEPDDPSSEDGRRARQRARDAKNVRPGRPE